MKTVWLVLILAGVFVFREAGAQVWVKAEYIGSSPFRDENNEKVGGKGDMMQPELTLSRSFSIPSPSASWPTAPPITTTAA